MNTYLIMALAVMSIITIALRVLPFQIFHKAETPEVIQYLGDVLPYSTMGLLVIYCLKDVNGSNLIPTVVSAFVVIASYVFKRNTLFSIVSGTLCYMFFVQVLFP